MAPRAPPPLPPPPHRLSLCLSIRCPQIDLASVAKGHATAGNADLLLKAMKLGYTIVDEASPGGDGEKSHAPHELVLQVRTLAIR